MFEIPTFKNTKYITHLQKPINLFLSDIKVKSLFKFSNNKGYLLNVYVPDTINKEVISELHNIDNNSFDEILHKSSQWFQKDFTEDSLKMLFEPSFCIQSSTIGIILASDVLTRITINDKITDDLDEVVDLLRNTKKLKQCIINANIHHNGLYFYKEKAVSKWIIKSIDITDISNDKCNLMKDDICDKIKDNISQLTKKVLHKITEHTKVINQLENDIVEINTEYEELYTTKNWIEATDRINKKIMLLKECLKNL